MLSKRCALLSLTVCLLVLTSSCGKRSSTIGNAAKQGKSITIAVYAGGMEGAIEGPLWHWKDQWEKQSGYTLNIVPIPYAQLRERVLTDLRTGMGQYDGFIVPSSYYGDLIDAGYIVPIDKYMKSEKYPHWDPVDIVPVLKPLLQWGGKWYGVPNDGDAQILYYRDDILRDPKWRAQYLKATGKPLPVPPRTWDDVLSIAKFFTGKDINGDGNPDYGISLELKPNDQSFNGFLAVTAPYVVNAGPRVDRYHDVYWFDPETMTPLVDTPGFLEGLKILISLFHCAPRAALSFGLEDTWNLFLNGQAVLCPTFGDLGALAQDPRKSKVRGKVGCTAMPGSLRLWDLQHKQWLKLLQPNMVSNTLGCSWHGLISKYSRHPDAVYDLYAYQAERPVHTFNVTHGWTGVNPIFAYDFPPPHGNGNIDDYVKAGWNKHDITQYLDAYYNDYYTGNAALTFLRIPKTEDFFNVLDQYMLKAVGGEITPEAALRNIQQGWNEIIQREGKDKLRQLYQESIGYQAHGG